MKKFSKSIFTAINKIFNVFLILVLFCHQLAWTMQDSQSGREGVASANRLISRRAIDEGLVTSQQYLQETELSQRSIKGDSSRHLQEEDNSEMSTILRDDEETSKWSGKKESSLADNSSMFFATKSKLSPIGKIETLPLRNAIRWASFDSVLQRMGYTLVLQTKHINPSFADKPCTRPVWLSGGSFPIHSESARKRVLFVDGFRQGAEFVIFRSLHLGITGLALYQMYNYIHQENPLVCQGTPQSKSVLGLVKFWEASDDNALLGLFHDILGEQSSFLSNLKYFLFAPIVYGIVQGGLNTQDSQWSHEQIQESLEKLAAQKPNVKTDLFRWLLPLNPIDKELSNLMKNVLWNGNISDEDLEEIWDRVEILATRHAWYTSINALGYAMNWAYGLNDRDIHTAKARLSENLLEEDLLDNMVPDDADSRFKKRQALKKKAFDLIQKCTAWRPDNLDDKKEVVRSGLRTIYAQYLLWSLGAPRSIVEGLWPTLFKLSKLYAQATFIQKIVQTFLKAETCPKQPGVSIAGVAPWASDLTQACFAAQVQAFNIIPGQPTDTLVGNLGQYYFQNCTIDLDLSNKGLSNGTVVAEIIKGLLKDNITVKYLNLSRNAINHGDDFEALLPLLGNLEVLDLSNNFIGGTGNLSTGDNDDSGTVALGENLKYLTHLTNLDLSGNSIGDTGTGTLGQNLKYLTHLTNLDLSNNYIGDTDTVAIGDSLKYLTHLTNLDLSGNSIGDNDDSGTVAIGENLKYLTHFTNLDLSNNQIGDTGTGILGDSLKYLTRLTNLVLSNNSIGDNGTVALGESVKYLTYLANLDLSGNLIGLTGGNATVVLGENLKYLTHLTNLDLSYNYIGYKGDNGTVAIGENLKYLTHLTNLDLSYNYIGVGNSSNVIFYIAINIAQLPNLKIFIFLPARYSVPNSYVIILNNALNHTSAKQILFYLDSIENVNLFCQSLSLFVTTINLSLRMNNPETLIIETLFKCLSNFPHLTHLDLSYNQIGFLSNNYTGTGDTGTVAIGENLRYITHLTHLDLSNNYIGYAGENGTVAIGDSLKYLTHLTNLDLSYNQIGILYDNDTVAIGDSLKYLTHLTNLDLSNNYIGYSGDTGAGGAVAIGDSLKYLTHLTNLDLSSNNFADTGAVAIGDSLKYLTHLTNLDLSYNNIGYTGDNGAVALANGISYLQSLTILTLGCTAYGCNYIGSTGLEGPTVLLSALITLPQLNLSALNVQGMTNISWTKSANHLQRLRTQAMMDACQSSRCFGGDVQKTTENDQSAQTSYQSTERRFLTLEKDWSVPATSSASRPFTLFSSFFKGMKDIAENPSVTCMMLGFGANILFKAGVPLLLAYAAIE